MLPWLNYLEKSQAVPKAKAVPCTFDVENHMRRQWFVGAHIPIAAGGSKD